MHLGQTLSTPIYTNNIFTPLAPRYVNADFHPFSTQEYSFYRIYNWKPVVGHTSLGISVGGLGALKGLIKPTEDLNHPFVPGFNTSTTMFEKNRHDGFAS